MLGFRALVAAILSLSLLAMAPADAVAETVSFKFKKKSDSKGWKPLWGKWSVTGAGYQPAASRSEAYSYAMTIYSPTNYSDVAIDFTINDHGIDDYSAYGWARVSYRIIRMDIL